MPSVETDELAGSETDFLDKHSDHLRATFRHDFARQGLPPASFRLASGDWDKDVKLTPEGLLTQAVTSRVTSVSLGHTVGGDFDIFARSTSFQSASEGAGARLMTKLQNPSLQEVIGGRKHMIHGKDFEENVGYLWHGFYDNGHIQYEYDKGQNIEEFAGTVRLSRRGDTIWILTAEPGSNHYRLHMKQKVGTEDLSAGGIQLQCEMPGASVIWTELEIHAERIQNCQQVIETLNRRDEHWRSTVLDFSKAPYDELLAKPADVKWIAGEGLRMQHTSDSGGWSTNMNTSQPLRGDFDVALDFEIEKLTTTGAGESSLLEFQIELADPERTRFHVVFLHEPTGVNRLAVHHQCFSARTGKEEGIESYAVILQTLTGLRIAQRGQTVTVIATSPDYGGEFVLAQFLRPLPVFPGKLNIFVHTGGPNATISVLLKKLQQGISN